MFISPPNRAYGLPLLFVWIWHSSHEFRGSHRNRTQYLAETVSLLCQTRDAAIWQGVNIIMCLIIQDTCPFACARTPFSCLRANGKPRPDVPEPFRQREAHITRFQFGFPFGMRASASRKKLFQSLVKGMK